jgi:tRNA pseudouridine55 synthase
MDEVIVINKPVGPTSHDVVNQVRRLAGTRRVGHAGTLDPLASGVLVVGIGSGTKKLGEITESEKEYVTVVKLGITSATDDEEGEKKERITPAVNREQINKVLNQFIGTIRQVPPIYSAIKVKGQVAYKLARAGKTIIMPPRVVEIKSIEILKFKWPMLKLKVICGSGVYIRSLARDLGEALSTGGYMAALTRTRVGKYTLDQAVKLPEFWVKKPD